MDPLLQRVVADAQAHAGILEVVAHHVLDRMIGTYPGRLNQHLV